MSPGPRGPRCLVLLAVLAAGPGIAGFWSSPAIGADRPSIDAGRSMYRDGIRPSGEPLTAIVAGDVPVLGSQFSCESCHGRSGMGAAEGEYIVPAVTGWMLYAPSNTPSRPAYDRKSLARALRDGVDPTGRPFDPLMPRYRLSDEEVATLADYLEGLSVRTSPGVDEKTIRFATLVTDDVDPGVRDAVLAVLETFANEKNRQTRLESQRPDRGTAPATRLPPVFREWVLDRWTLTGPAESWPEQLEKHYRDVPVFAVLGGLSGGAWGPIGRFCEQYELPCLFPGTDLPDAGDGDFYTLHFSRGLYLEADLIAAHIAEHPVPAVIQVFCGTASAAAAAALRSQLVAGGVEVEDVEFLCETPPPAARVAGRMADTPGSAAVLWLGRDRLAGFQNAALPGPVYLSSTLLERDLDGALGPAPGPVFVAHPFRLSTEPDPGFNRFRLWARTRGIELRYPRRQAEAFFACLAASHAVKHLYRYLVRDYALDMLDHAQGLAEYMPVHPRPTFGPGQRFLTKGGYVLPVSDGNPGTANAVWIVP